MVGDFPVAAEWHESLNGDLLPGQVSAGSHKKVWWKCSEHGHEWEALVRDRALKNRGCPVCRGQKVLAGFNDFATREPELAEEWHDSLNGDLLPSQVLPGTRRKVWWKCKDYGHAWIASLNGRTSPKRNGCAVCSGQQICVGFNDLSSQVPEVAAQWHPTLNSGLLPTEVTPASNRKVWWVCDLGHEWTTAVNLRVRGGTGCPYCSGFEVLRGFNDLASTHPSVAAEWDYSKNGDLQPNEVLRGTDRKAWWLCARHGHSWQASVASRSRGSGCPVCAGRVVIAGFNDLQTLRPDIASEWHPTRNGSLTAQAVTEIAGSRAWWLCTEYGHEWEAVIASRTKQGTGCPVCTGRSALKGFNDLATRCPNLAEEWSPRNGTLQPSQVTPGSNRKVWWNCTQRGHEWEAVICSRAIGGSGCPACRGSLIESRLRSWLGSGPLAAVTPPAHDMLTELRWPSGQTMRVDFLGTLPMTGKKVVVEYDGSFWHASDESYQRDLTKTATLLSAGYYIIRVREEPLAHLPVKDSCLLQLGHKFTGNEEDVLELVAHIEYWVEAMDRLDAGVELDETSAA